MLFNSLEFLVFFTIVYSAYSALGRWHRVQNWLLLAASYVFYGWWDVRFLSLIVISTAVDFTVGRQLGSESDERRRKPLLLASVATNLGILGYFKYAGFFVDSARELLASVGIDTGATLAIVLPVGISFYTFQTMAYTIDVYRRRLEPTNRLDDFALYVAFFPQLVAGPIERAQRLLVQISAPRTQTAAATNAGIWLVLWGLFKKMVIADNLAPLVDDVFAMNPERSGADVALGVVAFAIQIYGDFSGYSDIARGIAKMLGFDLVVNFRLPYVARNPSDFWERWHISLSSWLRDYLYIPLGGNRSGRTIRNLMLTMILGGLWHGAAWNFVLWGLYHGLLLVLYRTWLARFGRPSNDQVRTAAQIAVMLMFTLFGWLIFRASSLEAFWWVVTNMGLSFSPSTPIWAVSVLSAALVLGLVGHWQTRSQNLLAPARGPWIQLGATYGVLVVVLFLLGSRDQAEFIYFQF